MDIPFHLFINFLLHKLCYEVYDLERPYPLLLGQFWQYPLVKSWSMVVYSIQTENRESIILNFINELKKLNLSQSDTNSVLFDDILIYLYSFNTFFKENGCMKDCYFIIINHYNPVFSMQYIFKKYNVKYDPVLRKIRFFIYLEECENFAIKHRWIIE